MNSLSNIKLPTIKSNNNFLSSVNSMSGLKLPTSILPEQSVNSMSGLKLPTF